MIDLIVIVALLGFLGWLEWSHARERRYMINCLIARNPHEARILNQTPPPPRPEPDPEWDFVMEGYEGPVGLS